MAKKLITVIGATGAQGGGLARAILADPGGAFAVRAVTRQPGGDAARALATAGAEVVKADLDDVASLRRAFHGAYGAYCVTNYWEVMSPDREIEQAKNLADATRASSFAHRVVDARGHASARAARRPAHAHPARSLQGAAPRRQG